MGIHFCCKINNCYIATMPKHPKTTSIRYTCTCMCSVPYRLYVCRREFFIYLHEVDNKVVEESDAEHDVEGDNTLPEAKEAGTGEKRITVVSYRLCICMTFIHSIA